MKIIRVVLAILLVVCVIGFTACAHAYLAHQPGNWWDPIIKYAFGIGACVAVLIATGRDT